MMANNKKFSLMGKRRFFKTLATLGVSASTLYHDDGGNNDNGFALPATDRTFVGELAQKSGWVAGVTTYDAIKNHEGDSSWTVHKQGNRTGDTKGYVTDAVNDTSKEARSVWISADSGGGDSGGPYYRRIKQSDGSVQYYITRIHAWGTSDSCPNSPSGGNTMEYIEDNWGLTV